MWPLSSVPLLPSPGYFLGWLFTVPRAFLPITLHTPFHSSWDHRSPGMLLLLYHHWVPHHHGFFVTRKCQRAKSPGRSQRHNGYSGRPQNFLRKELKKCCLAGPIPACLPHPLQWKFSQEALWFLRQIDCQPDRVLPAGLPTYLGCSTQHGWDPVETLLLWTLSSHDLGLPFLMPGVREAESCLWNTVISSWLNISYTVVIGTLKTKN